MARKLRILLIEDNPGDARLIREMLEESGASRFEMTHVTRMEEALTCLGKATFDVLLLDLGLPDSQGLDTLARIHTQAPRIPIVVLTGLRDEELALEAVRAGAQDHLVKGQVDGEVLVRAMRYAIERRGVQQAMRESEQRYRTLFEGIGDGVLLHDEAGTILEANEVTCSRLGYKLAELQGMNIRELLPANWAARVPERIEQTIGSGSNAFETEFLARSGKTIPCAVLEHTIKYRGRRAIVSVARDIADHKQAEDALRISYRFLEIANRHAQVASLLREFVSEIRQVSGCAAVGIRILDDEGNIPYEAYEGFDREFYESESPLSIKSGRCMCINVIKGAADPKLPFYTNGGSFYMNGTTRFLATVSEEEKGQTRNVCNQFGYESVALIPIRVKDRILGLIHLADHQENCVPLQRVEVLEQAAMQLGTAILRVQSEQALQESEEKYRKLFEDSVEAISVTLGGNIVDVNPAWLRLHGFEDKAEVIGMDVLAIVHPEDRKRLVERRKMPPKRLERGYEIRDVRKDGSVVEVEVYSSTISLNGEEAILTTVRDISARKRAEEESAKLQAQFLQAQKMEAIGTLAGGVAHDFNNLLTAIKGFTELTMMEISKDEPVYDNLKRVRDTSDRAAGIIRQLLLFGRKQPMRSVPLDLNVTIENLLRMLSRLIGEDIKVNVEFERKPWTVSADPGNIEQVIMNLAVNARDAMSEGGKLTIRTENVMLDEEQSKAMPEGRPGKFVCLSVADTGCGIDEENLQHIFEPFFTTKAAGKGTGLGLSVVYGIVQQHGGWITIATERGKGSEFKIHLPASAQKPKKSAEETVTLKELQGKGERILVVEDEGEILKFTASVLRGNGYMVFDAVNAKQAVDAFERYKGDFDVILTDCVLPDKTGLQLVEQLLSRNPALRIVMTSGYTDDRSQWTVIREKGFGFLQKPYGVIDVLQTVRGATTQSQ